VSVCLSVCRSALSLALLLSHLSPNLGFSSCQHQLFWALKYHSDSAVPGGGSSFTCSLFPRRPFPQDPKH
jgi:hypothetical protein